MLAQIKLDNRGSVLNGRAHSVAASSQLLLKVVLAQIKLDNRHSFSRRSPKGVLVYLGDSRRKLHLHGNRHLPPLHTTVSLPWDT